MRLLADLHTHTVASGHAYSTVTELAWAAADKGLELIAVTDHGPTVPQGVRHDLTGTPSTRTVHAPHWPSPQPYFVPVNPKSSRNTLSSERSAAASQLRAAPLM